jgi:hypothetical protein
MNAADEVCLWILNDEGLYNLANRCKRRYGSYKGAEAFISELAQMGVTATPSGANYTISAVRRAMGSL